MRRSGQQLLIVYQTDHANLAQQFATHWGNENFQKPVPFMELCLAIRTHDDGWMYNDELPLIDSSAGRPCGLLSFPTEKLLAIDRDTIEIAKRRDTYARLMISMHRTGLWQQRYGIEAGWDVSIIQRMKEDLKPEVKEFLRTEEEWQKQIRDQNSGRKEFSDRYVWANYELMQVWDKMSLYLCHLDEDNPKAGTIARVPRGYSGNDETNLNLIPHSPTKVEVDPWPFDEMPSSSSPLVFAVRGFKIADRAYADSQELATELARAPQEVHRFELSNLR